MDDHPKTGFWTRVVADESFRDAVIDDPLRAMSEVRDVAVSARQIRQLEEMTRQERSELVIEVVRDAYMKGAVQRFGPLGADGSLGGRGSPTEPD